jgi:stage III sporulation protein SpoIIIAA
VYPNPAKDVLTIAGSHIAEVRVLDNLGRTLDVQTLKDATNPSVSVSNLATGVYHLRVRSMDGKVSMAGFVKE